MKFTGGYIWFAAIAYSIQLYMDFSGCMDIVLGTSECFGITLPENFRAPYLASSIKEFWRRWHISLSTWLRDYIYIPLGGSRKGKIVQYRNLLITFAVSGLWHGGSYKFLCWGILHAVYQIIGEIRTKFKCGLAIEKKCEVNRIVKIVGTCFWVMIGWLIFRANSLRDALIMLGLSLDFTGNIDSLPQFINETGISKHIISKIICLVGIISVFIVDYLSEKGIDLKGKFDKQHSLVRMLEYWLICILVIYLLCDVTEAPQFIYNQF